MWTSRPVFARIGAHQNRDFLFLQAHVGHFAPCLLTHSMIWSVKAHRQLIWQELFNLQGVPILPEAVEAAGVPCSKVTVDEGRASMTRMAGNAFHIACAGTFVGFILSNLHPRAQP